MGKMKRTGKTKLLCRLFVSANSSAIQVKSKVKVFIVFIVYIYPHPVGERFDSSPRYESNFGFHWHSFIHLKLSGLEDALKASSLWFFTPNHVFNNKVVSLLFKNAVILLKLNYLLHDQNSINLCLVRKLLSSQNANMAQCWKYSLESVTRLQWHL